MKPQALIFKAALALSVAPFAQADTGSDPFAMGGPASGSGASSYEVRELRERLEDLESRLSRSVGPIAGPMTDDMLINSLRQRDLGRGVGASSGLLAGSEPLGLINGRHFVKVAGQYLEVTAEQFAEVASSYSPPPPVTTDN